MEKIEVNLPEGSSDVTVLEGEARGEIYIQSILFDGTVQSVLEYARKRLVQPADSIFVYDSSLYRLELYMNQYHHDAPVIRGAMTLSDEFRMLKLCGTGVVDGINAWTSKELYRLIRFNPHLFDDEASVSVLLAELSEFKGRVIREFEESRQGDGKRQKDMSAHEIVTTFTTTNFVVNIPLFRGGDKHRLQVEVFFEPAGSSVTMYLMVLDVTKRIEKEWLGVIRSVRSLYPDVPTMEGSLSPVKYNGMNVIESKF